MTFKIIAFGIAKDILGRKAIEINIEANTNVASLKAELTKQYPALGELTSLAVAVNEEYQDDDYSLTDGMEVMLIPPVAGG